MTSSKTKPQAVESIAVREFFSSFGKQLKLRLVTSDKTLSRSTIKEKSVNRPALAVTGYFKYFANKVPNIYNIPLISNIYIGSIYHGIVNVYGELLMF